MPEDDAVRVRDLVLLLPLLAAALTGCDGTATTSADGAPVPASRAGEARPSAAERPAKAGRPKPAPTRRPAVRACAAPDLEASTGDTERRGMRDTTELRITEIVLTNRSASACSVRGWVGVTYRGTNIHHDASSGRGPDRDSVSWVRPAPVPVADATPRITVAPGQTASFEIGSTCCAGFIAAYRAELRLPGDDRPIGLVWGEEGGPIMINEQYQQHLGAIGVPIPYDEAGWPLRPDPAAGR
ncbi:DUF4232 domain-containing protein [Pimelobacter simplex]|uniref:DUF4232 domain-containing protein n=1 Tax=Nocardioides simplex TaxID=2045 RepID=UPI003AAA94BA